MAIKTSINCKCVYCGFEWTFYAKSKADAKRMNGDPVCAKQECRDKQLQDTLAKLGITNISTSETVS